MTDKIADIRERHAQSDANYIEFESTWDIHADRATLLAEDDRKSAEIEWLREALNEAIKEKNWLAKELADCQQLCDYLAGADR